MAPNTDVTPPLVFHVTRSTALLPKDSLVRSLSDHLTVGVEGEAIREFRLGREPLAHQTQLLLKIQGRIFRDK